LSEPRIAPLKSDEWNDKAKEVMAPIVARGRPINIFWTLAHNPDLMRRWLVFANHILGKSTLAPRDRELVILRIGYLCQAGYEWGQHVLISRHVGMSEDQIRAATTGPDTPGLGELDRLLLRATDELHADAHIADDTWAGLSGHLTTQQLMDLVFTVGQYNLVSMAMNSFGVQLDEGVPGWDV
jgi:alkylhydroperoxidase family enzyme